MIVYKKGDRRYTEATTSELVAETAERLSEVAPEMSAQLKGMATVLAHQEQVMPVHEVEENLKRRLSEKKGKKDA